MKRYYIYYVLLLCNMFPMFAAAYDRYGRDYSVRDGGGSSGGLVVLIIIGVVVYCLFNAGKKER